MFYQLLNSEWLKLKNSKIWFIVLASPALSAVIGFFPLFSIGSSKWLALSTQMILTHSALFLPLLTGVLAALLCSNEHAHGGWKQLLTLPVSRVQVYAAKYVIIMILLLFTQLFFLIGIWFVGSVQGFGSPFPWYSLVMSCLMGWLSCLPLAALQFWLATYFKSFAGPSTVNVMLTLPAILIANSELLGPLYPWSHPMLSMTQAFSAAMGGDAGFLANESAFYPTLIVSFVAFIGGGALYFHKKEWT
ncbi:ABC transporter permease [Bacillus paralicheniformis]|jgi:hypothetical protein|uniref:ABC transporter permease n=2 Tax=Bacillus subtilis group TaxID=653685 RepID=A0AAW6KGQ2_9BACI|nr:MULTISPECIES: ABC transporter permease [Bacillus]KUL13542.1 hypothetical protein LI7559_06670 [Bacillus licheniformis LMG 7559]KUL17717.1 hypothetical protein LI6934_09735 [Bacillus licheniformis LMG 6934]AGN34605.1 lantibiotic immunity protein LanE [Bacillus paralicheniformis ATCC 9945a]AJO16296.1 hypothetical protein SC10_B2orf00209 [Bacillus paralicheniformis]ARA84140.1 hypothetical protein BLMD_00980 [Bacillus paralicheniformis]